MQVNPLKPRKVITLIPQGTREAAKAPEAKEAKPNPKTLLIAPIKESGRDPVIPSLPKEGEKAELLTVRDCQTHFCCCSSEKWGRFLIRRKHLEPLLLGGASK